jgi:DNA-binding response OmpR family regulator
VQRKIHKLNLDGEILYGHILIVEDEANIARMIQTTLEIGGYTSEICADGEAAVRRILAGGMDLILLDVMLPKLDGFQVLERIGTIPAPVIFLTAMGDISDKVRGLRMGANDYIVKPFEAMELLVRIEVALRGTKRDMPAIISFKDIKVDVERHQVVRAGVPAQLTPKEFDLLVFLIRNVDIALTRERLLAVVWGYDVAGETRTVDTHVQQLRKKLGLQDSLVTISRLGYRLESPSSVGAAAGAGAAGAAAGASAVLAATAATAATGTTPPQAAAAAPAPPQAAVPPAASPTPPPTANTTNL